jgi:hypothetical protein
MILLSSAYAFLHCNVGGNLGTGGDDTTGIENLKRRSAPTLTQKPKPT